MPNCIELRYCALACAGRDLRLTGGTASIIELLAMPDAESIEFKPPRAQGFTRPADLG